TNGRRPARGGATPTHGCSGDSRDRCIGDTGNENLRQRDFDGDDLHRHLLGLHGAATGECNVLPRTECQLFQSICRRMANASATSISEESQMFPCCHRTAPVSTKRRNRALHKATMKKLLLTGIAALFLATGTAHAQLNSFPRGDWRGGCGSSWQIC